MSTPPRFIDSKPSLAVDGDMWIDTNDGQMYLYSTINGWMPMSTNTSYTVVSDVNWSWDDNNIVVENRTWLGDNWQEFKKWLADLGEDYSHITFNPPTTIHFDNLTPALKTMITLRWK